MTILNHTQGSFESQNTSWLKPILYFIVFPDLKVGVIINPTLQSGVLELKRIGFSHDLGMIADSHFKF